MESHTKTCIINVGLGGWYPKGSERLKRSLIYHGFAWDILIWTDWPNDNFDKSCAYNVKAAAFEEAIKAGYTHILWCDSSVWAINDISPVLDKLNEQGYYLLASGYNAAQTCSDRCLKYFDLDRDDAELIPDTQTTVMGVNMDNPDGFSFMQMWLQAARDGVFKGSRLHDDQSEDPRFLFHRQDQSAATCIAGHLNLKLEYLGEKVSYYEPQLKESVVLTMRGM